MTLKQVREAEYRPVLRSESVKASAGRREAAKAECETYKEKHSQTCAATRMPRKRIDWRSRWGGGLLLHTLDEWREMPYAKSKALLTAEENNILAAAFDETVMEYFGFPERLAAQDMDLDGAVRLTGAVVKEMLHPCLELEKLEYNDGMPYVMFHGCPADEPLPPKLMARIRADAEEAIEWLYSESGQALTLGNSEGVHKGLIYAAKKEVDDFYAEVRQQLMGAMGKKNATVKDVAAAMGIEAETLEDFIMHRPRGRVLDEVNKTIRKMKKIRKETKK